MLAEPTHSTRTKQLVLTAVLGISACSPAAIEPPSGNLKVLTYNVHGLPPTITGDDTPGRMVQISPLLSPFDIVALQEDFDSSNHELLVEETDHPTQVRFDETLADRVYGSGLSLLARTPELFHNHHLYSTCHGTLENASDCLASKGLQLVRLDLDGQGTTLDFLNTHHEAGGSTEDDASRATQVSEVLEILDTISKDRAVIFGGDFNLHGDDPEDQAEVLRYLEEGGLTEGCDSVNCEEPGRIDRFFFRSSNQLRITPNSWAVDDSFFDDEGTALSDHDAISMSFGWEVLSNEASP